jgi:hypothetical protein
MSKAQKNVVAQEVTNEVTTEVVTQEQVKSFVIPLDGSGADKYIADAGSVSSAIRKLIADNYSRGEVAKMLNKRYQHVRNVMITPLKKNG